jgi:hypothetical protein
MKKAGGPNPSPQAVERLYQHIAANPDDSYELANIVAVTMRNLSQSIGRTLKQPAYSAYLLAGAEQLVRDLGYQSSPQLERLLIEQIVVCWLQVYWAQLICDSNDRPQSEIWEKRLTASQRRYLRAVEMLAKIRRLNLPAIQVNIGENQINVSG